MGPVETREGGVAGLPERCGAESGHGKRGGRATSANVSSTSQHLVSAFPELRLIREAKFYALYLVFYTARCCAHRDPSAKRHFVNMLSFAPEAALLDQAEQSRANDNRTSAAIFEQRAAALNAGRQSYCR